MLLYSLQRGVYGRLWIGAVSAVLSNIRRTTPWNSSGSVDLILLFQGTLLYFSQCKTEELPSLLFFCNTHEYLMYLFTTLSLSLTRIYLNLNNSQFYSTERINWFSTHPHTHTHALYWIYRNYISDWSTRTNSLMKTEMIHQPPLLCLATHFWSKYSRITFCNPRIQLYLSNCAFKWIR